MASNIAHINNGIITDLFYPPKQDREYTDYKSMVRLPKGSSGEIYMDVIKKIHDASPNPLPNNGNRKSPYESPYIKLLHDSQGYHQIETNLEPQELLGALASSGLITQEEMIGAYKDLGLTPKNRAIGNGLHPMDTPNQKPLNQPSFSLF